MDSPVAKAPTPTSAPGRCSAAVRRGAGAAAGFTLLELMVVIVLAGILLSIVSIGVAPDPAQALGREAQRIGQLMQVAADESRIRQQPIDWEADLTGYRWYVEVDGERQMLTDDDLLRERRWERPLSRLAVEDAAGRPTQALLAQGAPPVRVPVAREWIQPRWRLDLANDLASVAVDFDPAGEGRVAAAAANDAQAR